MKKLTSIAALSFMIAGAAAVAQELPMLEPQDQYTVGFAQTESNNPWRIAQTRSFQETAESCNWNLVYTDAAGSAAKQVADVDSMIAQGVDVIFLPPREEQPLLPAVFRARDAGIPLFLVDRSVDSNVAQAGVDFVTFMGSDFIDQGRRAAEWLIENSDGTEVIVELEGTTGSSPANDRKQGFDDAIAGQSGMTIVASQSGDFSRDQGRQVMETLLQSHPELTVVYAHNDEMAIGAIQALEAAGRTPGEDVTLVSIDGTRDALQAIIDGKLGVSVESSPFFGPIACDTMNAYAAGEDVPVWVKVEDRIFTIENAADHIAEAY